ncbi:hypothetical protein [Arthrobacter woluwensis]|uniref:hypothetical protein n=1 Tax=Arthrobacter woluwensis TaxID=156980 RepID=UPI00119D2F4B|nr:hypothetical protein [Arthrobacter woluwensis]
MADREAPTPARTIGPVTTAASGSVAVVVVLAYMLRAIWGIELPEEVTGAAAVLVSLIAGYLVPPKEGA